MVILTVVVSDITKMHSGENLLSSSVNSTVEMQSAFLFERYASPIGKVNMRILVFHAILGSNFLLQDVKHG